MNRLLENSNEVKKKSAFEFGFCRLMDIDSNCTFSIGPSCSMQTRSKLISLKQLEGCTKQKIEKKCRFDFSIKIN